MKGGTDGQIDGWMDGWRQAGRQVGRQGGEIQDGQCGVLGGMCREGKECMPTCSKVRNSHMRRRAQAARSKKMSAHGRASELPFLCGIEKEKAPGGQGSATGGLRHACTGQASTYVVKLRYFGQV